MMTHELANPKFKSDSVESMMTQDLQTLNLKVIQLKV